MKENMMPSPEDMAKLTKKRILSDAELIKGGAEIETDEKGKITNLLATKRQKNEFQKYPAGKSYEDMKSANLLREWNYYYLVLGDGEIVCAKFLKHDDQGRLKFTIVEPKPENPDYPVDLRLNTNEALFVSGEEFEKHKEIQKK